MVGGAVFHKGPCIRTVPVGYLGSRGRLNGGSKIRDRSPQPAFGSTELRRPSGATTTARVVAKIRDAPSRR